MFKCKQININKKVITSGRTLGHVAKVYDYLSPLMTFCQEKRISEEAIKLLRLKRVHRILDIGCGTGTLTINIARKLQKLKNNFLVVGIDAAPEMVELSRKKSREIKNIQFDFEAGEQLPYENEFFDSVISTFFFHHIDYTLKKKVLSEIYRVLKKDGNAVIVDVDTPVNFFGLLCAWCGYIIFRQKEIKENIEGKLREAVDFSPFSKYYKMSEHLGYISIYNLEKQEVIK